MAEANKPAGISELLLPRTINLSIKATTVSGVLRELAELVPDLPGTPNFETFCKALQEREELQTTAVGEGVAFPHARATLGLTRKPWIIFGRHPGGIPFKAVDKQPVRLLFLLAPTSTTEHLFLLSRVSRLMRNPAMRTSLLKAGDPQEIIHLIRSAEQQM
ncbi:MAG: PTS sugar transporter subunit IIA [Verrucomicrobiota bacterium]|nr:PTS sugar transporter subunit IIA [Verrucomicrobiota bacterium]